jgi:endonuclease/exonuclease/phosphatase family metal-dependent hydrolase
LRKTRFLFLVSILLPAFASGAARAALPKPAIPVLATSLNFSVLSYNIKGLPSFAAPGFDEDRYGDIGKILAERNLRGAGPDIVALQESFTARTAELRAIANFRYSAKGPDAASLMGVDSGLYILSRYPIIKEESRAFGPELCASWDCYSNKGVQLARIKLPGLPMPVDVYNTHMQASRQSDGIRRGQVKTILEFIAATHTPGAPIIFAGDFNFRPSAGDLGFADFSKGSGLIHAGKLCLSLKCETAKGYDLRRLFETSVDHQFISSGEKDGFSLLPKKAERNFLDPVKGRALSDHLGYEVQYELKWAAPKSSPL